MFKINKYFLLYVLVSVYKKIYIIQIISQSIRHAIHRYCFQTVIARHLNTFSPGAPGARVLRELSGSGTWCSLGEKDEEIAATRPEPSRSLCSAGDRGRHWADGTLRFPRSLKKPHGITPLIGVITLMSVNYSQLWCMFTMECERW